MSDDPFFGGEDFTVPKSTQDPFFGDTTAPIKPTQDLLPSDTSVKQTQKKTKASTVPAVPKPTGVPLLKQTVTQGTGLAQDDFFGGQDFAAEAAYRIEAERLNKIEDDVVLQTAETLLSKFGNVLNVPSVIVGTAAQNFAIQGISHKNHVREKILIGEVKVPEDIRRAVLNANDDQFIVTVKPLAKGKYGKVLIKVVTNYVPKGWNTDKKKPVVKEFWLDDYSVNDYDEWLKGTTASGQSRIMSGLKETGEMALGSLTTKTPMMQRSGKQRIADFTSSMLESQIPGTPSYVPVAAFGFAGDVALPGTTELMPIGKAIKGASKLIASTPAVQKVIQIAAATPIVGSLMSWWGVKTKAMRDLEQLVAIEKVIAAAAKEEVIEGIRKAALKTGAKEAKKSGKILEPSVITEQEKNFSNWLIQGGGIEEIQSRLNAGQSMDAIFRNPKLLAKIFGMSEEKIGKYVGLHDLRRLGEYIEGAKKSGTLGKETADELRKVRNITEQIKLESGQITPAMLTREGPEYIPRKGMGTRRVPGTTYRYSNIKPESLKARIHDIRSAWEKALFKNNKNLPDYNIFKVLAEDAEDAINYALQKTIEDGMISKGIAKKLQSTKALFGKSKEAFENVRKGLDLKFPTKGSILIDNVKDFETRLRILRSKKVPNPMDLHEIWYPIGRIRFYLDETGDQLAKALEHADGAVAEQLKVAIDNLGRLYEKIDPKDMMPFLKTLDEYGKDAIVQKYAKGSIAVTGRVPAYTVEKPIWNLIQAETKSMFSPDTAKALRIVSRIQRPFAALVTTWNIRFWEKFVMTNFTQLLHGGMEAPMILPRMVQAAKVMARKGMIDIAGAKIPSDVVYNAAKGAASTFRGTIKADDFNNIMVAMYDLFGRNRLGRGTQKVLQAPGNWFNWVDDLYRFTDVIDYAARTARERGIRTTGEIIDIIKKEGVEHSMTYLFNYTDLPRFLKKARAFFPFLAFFYKIIPDQAKLMTKFALMHDVFAGKRSLQNAIGIPDTPLQYDYLRRSQDLKMSDPQTGRVISINVGFPYEKMYDLKNAEEYFSGLFRLLGPVGALPFHIAGVKTYPTMERYGQTVLATPEKVDAPAYMALIPAKIRDLPSTQDVLGLSWRIDADTGQKILIMNRQALDIIHDFNPWFLSLHENTKNIKITVSGMNLDMDSLEELKEELKAAHEKGEYLTKRDIRRIRPYRLSPTETTKLVVQKYKLPGVYEADPAMFLWMRIQRFKYLMSRQDVQGAMKLDPKQGLVIVDPKVKIKEMAEIEDLFRMLTTYFGKDWLVDRDLKEIERRFQAVSDRTFAEPPAIKDITEGYELPERAKEVP